MFSKAESAALELKQAKGSGQQMLSMLKKSGVKPEEMQYLGLDEFLKDKKSVTRDEIHDHIVQNQITVEETVLGVGPEIDMQRVPDENTGWDRWESPHQEGDLWIEKRGDNDYAGGMESGEYVNEKTFDSALAELQRFTREESESFAPQHPTLVEPGAVEGSYRELLLRLPRKDVGKRLPPSVTRDDVVRAISDGIEAKESYVRGELGGVVDAVMKSSDVMGTLAKELPNAEFKEAFDLLFENAKQYDYTGGHYGEYPNTLAHIRFNERTGPKGEKVLFVEEIQSDWHQEGRKKGYKGDPAEIARLKSKVDAEQAKFDDIYDRWQEAEPAEASRLRGERVEAAGRFRRAAEAHLAARGEVPDAPFKTSWHELAMKRMIKYAVDNGYDAIAWTKGETQFKRYGSSEIAWVKNTPMEVSVFELSPGLAKDAGGKYAISVERKGSPPDPYHKAYKTRSEAELAAAELKKVLLAEAKADPGWKVKATEQRGGEAGGIDIEGAARAEGILKEGGSRITTKEQLRDVVENTLMDRERGQWSAENFAKQVDKLTNRVWERMQTEDAGTSLPRKEGMEGFYDKMMVQIKK